MARFTSTAPQILSVASEYVKSEKSMVLRIAMRRMDMRQALCLGKQLDAEGGALHAHETHTEDEHQPDLLSPGKPESDDEGNWQEENHKVGDDVGVRVADLDGQAEALPLNCPVPNGLEGDAVNEGRHQDPDGAGPDNGQDDAGC